MENIYEKALKAHEATHGKVEMRSKMPVTNKDELSIAYTPGVAEPCRAIAKNPEDIYKYTSKGNTVAVISDGSAVLGLGNIGAKASVPVMEGKAVLMKAFAGLDSFPVCIDTQDTEEIINIVKNIGSTFGAINLEDISAPRCIEIETRLKEIMDIPVFHDDQHGTAIVLAAALINAAKVANKSIDSLTIAQSGTGAAGISIIKMMNMLGVKKIRAYNINGVVNSNTKAKNDKYVNQLISDGLLEDFKHGSTLADIVKGADVFIGVSAPGVLTKEMVKTMNDKSIVFAMANPTPEIMPNEAKEAGAFIVGTGRSDFPNQINNVLAFPGIFKGALQSRARQITDDMKLEAARALAALVKPADLSVDKIIPNPFEPGIADHVAAAVAKFVKK